MLNWMSEFKNAQVELEFQNYFWSSRKSYFFISYLICCSLFLIHGLFDFRREFIYFDPLYVMVIRIFLFLFSLYFVFKNYRSNNPPKLLYESCFLMQLLSVLIIFLLTIFTGGMSKTLHIGAMIMFSSFYIMLPGKSLYALISSFLISSVYILLADRSDPNFYLISFIIIASNCILWFFCKNQHKYNRLEFEHQKNLKDLSLMKGKMLTTLAHDIRSPLSVILLRSELSVAKNNQMDLERVFKNMESIKKNTLKIENLIGDLIKWTLSQNSRTSLALDKSHSIAQTIDNSISYLQDAAILKNISFLKKVEDYDFVFDPAMVETILRNLISNSIKFSRPDSSIEIRGEYRNGYFIEIFDSAATLSDEQILKIKKGESQVSKEGTKGEKGYGVGLSLVHTFLGEHKASLEIKSHPDKGNIFKIKFPA